MQRKFNNAEITAFTIKVVTKTNGLTWAGAMGMLMVLGAAPPAWPVEVSEEIA